MQGKSAPPRPEYRVADAQGNKIGVVTSGTMSPSLETGLGMALIQTSMAQPGTTLQIEIRNRWFPAQVCKKPLYRKT
jgi:aminomethyltransferase